MKHLKTATLIALTLSGSAMADGVYLGGWSTHYGNETVTNETHNLVMVEYDGFLVGTMVNSYGNRSHLVGYEYTVKDNEYIDFALWGALATGYEKDQTPFYVAGLSPLGGLGFKVETPYVKPTLLVAPNMALLTFKLEF